MVLILFIGLKAVTDCAFLKYVQVFGLSLMIIGVALFIWVLSMVDFFDLMGRVIYNRALAMILSICIMFLITIIMTVHSYMFEKNNT